MLHGLGRRIGDLVRLAMVLVVAVAGSQLAAFMSAYEQNLAGRLAEAQRDVAAIVDRAREADLPLYAYLAEFQDSPNPVFVREGAALRAKIDRAAFLADDLGALDRAGVVLKPVVFVGRLDPEVARDAWRRFDPALALNGVGLIYTGAGLLLGLFVAEFVLATARLGARPIRRFARPALR